MDRDLDKKIRRSRKALQNPYAYLHGESGYDAVIRRAPEVHEARRLLENQYAYLDGEGGYTEYVGHKRASVRAPLIKAERIFGHRRRGGRFSKSEIKDLVRKLHIEMWRRRAEIWPGRQEAGPQDILDPSVALACIGYSVAMEESLGQHTGNGEQFEVAGILDNRNRRVRVSRRFTPEIRAFTTAHELGHAILHAEPGLHRDRPLDGTSGNRPRDQKEVEADIFAAYFLLPDKQVRAAFEQTFLTHRFILNEETAFALGSENSESIQDKCRTLRDLSRMLAGAEYYNGVRFYSLAKRFGVSIGAMAIRLEELSLVGRDSR